MKGKMANDRRDFLKATGGAILAAGSIGVMQSSAQHHRKVAFSVAGDPLGSATVSFGGWMAGMTPPLDRFAGSPPNANHHELIPNVAKIKVGGYVNFVISGFHVVTIYDDGTKPADIDTTILVPGPRPGPPIINDPDRRIYRGADPVVSAGPPPVFNIDRTEVVHFHTPGTYLVICGVTFHFAEGMFGYVRVLAVDDSTAGG